MPRSVGVHPYAYKLELHHDLEDTIVTRSRARWLIDYYCERLSLPPVDLKWGRQTKRRHGTYYHIESDQNARILLHESGENVATILHELAHHMQYNYYMDLTSGPKLVIPTSSHDSLFQVEHVRILETWTYDLWIKTVGSFFKCEVCGSEYCLGKKEHA